MADGAFDLGDRLPTLTASRVRLRWLTEGDVPALLAIFGDPRVMRYWSHGPFADFNAAHGYLMRIHQCFRERSLFQWGVELIDAGEIIGTCTLAHLNADHRRAELGFALAQKHWRKGYMLEAVGVLLQFAFAKLHLHRLTADADPRNASSIRLLERLGFQREGLLREHYLLSGEQQDAQLFGLLRTEFKAEQPGR